MRMHIGRTMLALSRGARAAGGIAVLMGAAGCVEWHQTVASDRPTIANFISAVSAANGTATAALRSGTPTGGNGAPVVTAPIPALVLLGGTIQVTATSATPFTKVAVVIPELDDHWELTLPAATT